MAIEKEAYPGQNREHAQGTFADEGHPVTSQHNDRDQEDLDKDFVNRTSADRDSTMDTYTASTPTTSRAATEDDDDDIIDVDDDDMDADEEDDSEADEDDNLPETGFNTPNDPGDDPTPGFGI